MSKTLHASQGVHYARDITELLSFMPYSTGTRFGRFISGTIYRESCWVIYHYGAIKGYIKGITPRATEQYITGVYRERTQSCVFVSHMYIAGVI